MHDVLVSRWYVRCWPRPALRISLPGACVMERALASTSLAGRSLCASTASLSQSSSLHDLQQGGRVAGPLLQGRGIYPRQSNSHRLRFLPPPSRLVVPSAFASVRTITNFRGLSGCRPSVPQALPYQHCMDALADRLHLSNVLSSSLSSRWIDPNENGLTHAQGSFAPGAKTHD